MKNITQHEFVQKCRVTRKLPHILLQAIKYSNEGGQLLLFIVVCPCTALVAVSVSSEIYTL